MTATAAPTEAKPPACTLQHCVVAIDLPVELGYQCPIHKRDIMDTDLYGPPVLQWSEWPWPCSTERLHRLAEGSTDA